MTHDPNHPDRRDELRRRAEADLVGRPADDPELSALPPVDTGRLVHELRVHQIELEMQNEELRRAQEELQTARDRYRALYDFAPVGYLTVAEEGTIQEANLTAASLLGVERADMVDRPFSRLVAREDADVLYLHSQRMRTGLQRETWETRLRKGDGTVFWAQVDCRAVTDAGGRFVACRSALTDITERRQMAQAQIGMQRLRAARDLAVGVSHNLNNMLTTVLGPAHLILRLSDDPEVRREAEEILSAAGRARDLVQRLNQAVSGQTDGALCGVPVNQVVPPAVQAGQHRWQDEVHEKGISIRMVVELNEVPDVRGTNAELHNVLVNLLVNAVDAMPQGGTITLRTRAVADEVQVSVTDTGVGMEEETRGRIFEPLFTTKMSVGPGLGLATAHGMVTRWGGRIEVDSMPGKGTTLTLHLPVWVEPESG